MGGFATLVLAYVVSGVAGATVQVWLGIAFRAQEDLIIGLMVLAGMTFAVMLVLGISMAASSRASGIAVTAIVLFAVPTLVIAALAMFLVLAFPSTPIAHDDIAIVLGIEIPLAVVIAVQWWLMRRHWLKAHAA